MAEESNVQPQTAEPPLPNSPEARTPSGELKDQGARNEGIQAEPTPKADDAKPTVPDEYKFTGEPDRAIVDRATPIFKELGLTQDAAQKLVDFYNKVQSDNTEAGRKAVTEMGDKWLGQIKSDSEMGSKIEQVQADIGRMYTHLPTGLVQEFKEAMNLTMAGNHPAFVKTMWKLSQLVNEGTHVGGSGPSREGQAAPRVNSRPSPAQALYPNLPSSQ